MWEAFEGWRTFALSPERILRNKNQTTQTRAKKITTSVRWHALSNWDSVGLSSSGSGDTVRNKIRWCRQGVSSMVKWCDKVSSKWGCYFSFFLGWLCLLQHKSKSKPAQKNNTPEGSQGFAYIFRHFGFQICPRSTVEQDGVGLEWRAGNAAM